MNLPKIQNNTNIFIIDDEELIALTLKMYLEKGGYENLHVFTDSVEAMEMLTYVKADLILTDVDMPDLNGKFLARLARKTDHLKNTPIIVVTADDSDATRKNLVGNGVDAILHKPIDCDLLNETVGKMLRACLVNEKAKSAGSSVDARKRNVIKKEKKLRRAFNR